MGAEDRAQPVPDAPRAAPEGEPSTDERAEHERTRELRGLSDTVAQQRVEQLIGKDPANATTDTLLSAESKEEGILAYSFTSNIQREPKTKESRSKYSPEKVLLKEEFHEGDVVTVDFKTNNHAKWNIGAGDLLPPTVRQITVTDLQGNKRTSTRRLGLKGGFFDDESYIPVFSGYKIEIKNVWTEAELREFRKPNGKWDRKKYEERNGADDQRFAKEVYKKTYHEEWKGERIDAEAVQRLQVKSGLERGETLSHLLDRKPHYREAAADASRIYGVHTNTIFAFIKYESSFNEYAAARTSTARGLGQFLEGTWKGFIKEIKKESHPDHALYVKMMADPEWGKRNPLEWRFHPEASIHAVAWYTKQNAQMLGIALDNTYDLYMAHHEGAGGYKAYKRYKEIVTAHPQWSVKECATAAHLADFQMKRVRNGNDPFAAVEAYARRVANTADDYSTELSG